MEKVKELIIKANKSLKTADHLTYITYKLVNDPKLTIAILENINLTLVSAMEAVLHFDRLFKRIQPYPQNFDSKFQVFKESCVPRYNISTKHLILIQEIKSILEKHKESPMEFIRKDKFVIASSAYRLQTISINTIKKYLADTKGFMEEVKNIFRENARLF